MASEPSWNWKKVLTIIIVLLLVLYILIKIFLILWDYLTVYGAIIVYCGGLYYLLYQAARIILFPGSNYIYLRSFEQDREKSIAQFLLSRLKAFHEAATSSNEYAFIDASCNTLIECSRQARLITKGLKRNAEIQQLSNELTKHQEQFTSYLDRLRTVMKEIQIEEGGRTLTLWEVPKKLRSHASSIEMRLINKEGAQDLVAILSTIEEFLEKIVSPKRLWEKVSNFLFHKTFGHLSYMRAEGKRLRKIEPISVPSASGNVIDGMIVKLQEAPEGVLDNNPETTSYVLFCNPNAGYYEYALDYQDHWIKMYEKYGFDICFWNYRGYGRSKGSPSPKNIFEDGGEVIKYLKTEKRATKILVHGESLGGAVAVHLARYYGCDFLFADRTFSDMTTLANVNAGSFLTSVLSLVTGWTFDTAADYLQAQCFKVISNDPKDLMIHELASLKSGVARLVIFGIQGNDIQKYHMLSKKEAGDFCNILQALHCMGHTNDVGEFILRSILLSNFTQGKEKEANYLQHNDSLIVDKHSPTPDISVPEEPHVETAVTKKDKEIIESTQQKIWKELEKINGGGLTFERVIAETKVPKIILLMQLLKSLDAWGIYREPRTERLAFEIIGANKRREDTLAKVQEVKHNIKNIIEDSVFTQNYVLNKLGKVAKGILHYLGLIERFLEERVTYLKRKIQTQEEINEYTLNTTIGTGIDQERRNSSPREDSPFVDRALPDEKVLGELLPLTCGHNGTPRYDELMLYESYLNRSGIFIKKSD